MGKRQACGFPGFWISLTPTVKLLGYRHGHPQTGHLPLPSWQLLDSLGPHCSPVSPERISSCVARGEAVWRYLPSPLNSPNGLFVLWVLKPLWGLGDREGLLLLPGYSTAPSGCPVFKFHMAWLLPMSNASGPASPLCLQPG